MSVSKHPPPHDEAVIVTKAYDLNLWIVQKVEHLPRSFRFTIGERLTQNSLDLMLTLVEAAYTRDKLTLLGKANHVVNAIRYLLRTAKDLKILHADAFHFAVERLDEVGRMVGGWQKAVSGRPT